MRKSRKCGKPRNRAGRFNSSRQFNHFGEEWSSKFKISQAEESKANDVTIKGSG